MFGLSISTVIGAPSAGILDALFSFLVTSIETKGKLHSFRQRFQVFYGSCVLDNLLLVSFFFFAVEEVVPSLTYTLLEILCMVKNKTSVSFLYSDSCIRVDCVSVCLFYVLYGDCYVEFICLLPRDILSG